jgi:aspartate aminotransferase-like enzyme
VVDAISALGAMTLPMDGWGIDVLVSACHKALGLPPGLAFLAAGEKAWKLNESADLPRFYFDARRERDNQKKNQTAWTPAISLVEGLDESLKMFREEGLTAVFARHERMARAARAGMQALGLTLYSKSPSAAMTTVLAPDGVDSEKLVKHLFANYGIKLVGGQDAAKGKIFRIAHLGYFDDFDMLVVIGAVERGLHDLGAKIELGAGLAAAQRSFAGQGK